MTESKPRFSFLPVMLLLVGMVLCAVVVVAFVPLVQCGYCKGEGFLDPDRFPGISLPYKCEVCSACEATGRRTLYARWFKPDGSRNWDNVVYSAPLEEVAP